MRRRLVIALLGAGLTPMLAGCESYRIEYHRARPKYYERMGIATDERIELEDGTVLVYGNPDGPPVSSSRVNPGENFDIHTVDDEGLVRFHALVPEHVLMNAFSCIQAREYELMWEELVSADTRFAYAERGMGFNEFADWCEANRIPLARFLKFMLLSFSHYEVVVEDLGTMTRCRLGPQTDTKKHFPFTTVEVVREDMTLKLRVIY